ncbi:Cytochrome P450 [Mycena venus]|uniref:Cytochrome P450 n=1 Tax=Mycena venus TaxID=2733690 RepID=A0A8H6YJ17_9AGAR|nr:Cytochrome P450 [Mycena venus]
MISAAEHPACADEAAWFHACRVDDVDSIDDFVNDFLYQFPHECFLPHRGSGPRIPGPPAHPLVGHTFQVPTIKTWKYYEDLWHKHGPIVKLTLAGDDILVLSDPADAQELELASVKPFTDILDSWLGLILLPLFSLAIFTSRMICLPPSHLN